MFIFSCIDWKWPPERPYHTCPTATESDPRSKNIGPTCVQEGILEKASIRLWTWQCSRRV